MTNIKALEIKTSMRFKLDFASNAILSCFFYFFIIVHLYFLFTAVNAQIFNTVAEVVIPFGKPIKEANAEVETNQHNSKVYKCFLCFLLICSFWYISSNK